MKRRNKQDECVKYLFILWFKEAVSRNSAKFNHYEPVTRSSETEKKKQIQKKAPTVEPVYGQFPMYRQNSHTFALKKTLYNMDPL